MVACVRRVPALLPPTGVPGLPLVEDATGALVGVVFSTLERLAAAMGAVDWISLPGRELLRLPVVPRFVVIDPLSPHGTTVDASGRAAGAEHISGIPLRMTGLETTAAGVRADVAFLPGGVVTREGDR